MLVIAGLISDASVLDAWLLLNSLCLDVRLLKCLCLDVRLLKCLCLDV
jgi:hypothetical protein